MKRALIAVLSLPLMAAQCVTTDTSFIPHLDPLPAETRKPCPPLPQLSGTLGDLAMKDTSASIEYARCQARAATAVGAYESARQLLDLARQKADSKKTPNKPE